VEPEQPVLVQGHLDVGASELVLQAVREQQMSSHGSMVPKPPGGPSLDWALMTIEPPEAKKIPSPRTFHGDTVIDEYAWLADRQDPDTISYLKAENSYTDALTAHLAPVREQIFEEIKPRTQHSDL